MCFRRYFIFCEINTMKGEKESSAGTTTAGWDSPYELTLSFLPWIRLCVNSAPAGSRRVTLFSNNNDFPVSREVDKSDAWWIFNILTPAGYSSLRFAMDISQAMAVMDFQIWVRPYIVRETRANRKEALALFPLVSGWKHSKKHNLLWEKPSFSLWLIK